MGQDNDPLDPRVFCFARPSESEGFDLAVTKLMAMLQERARAAYVSPHNIMRMTHGQSMAPLLRENAGDVSMHRISAEWHIPFKDLVENDLSLIGRSLVPVNEDMARQFAQNFYGVVGAAAEQVGNVVDAQAAGSVAASMVEMMSKIELGVDRDGNVVMPQIHAGSEAFEKLVDATENMDSELAAAFERLKHEKSQQALDREASRRAKFKVADQ